MKVPRRPYWKKRALALAWVILGVLSSVGMTWGLVELDALVHRGEARAVAVSSAEPERLEAPTTHEKAMVASRPSAPRTTPQSSRFHAHIPEVLHSAWERLLAGVVMLAIGTTILAGFYRYAVKHPVGIRRRAWPGAITAVAVWLAVSWVFGQYAASLGDYAVYYGGLAAVAVVLVWLYLTRASSCASAPR